MGGSIGKKTEIAARLLGVAATAGYFGGAAYLVGKAAVEAKKRGDPAWDQEYKKLSAEERRALDAHFGLGDDEEPGAGRRR